MNNLDCDVRLAVYQHFISQGKAPAATEIGQILNVEADKIHQSFKRLAEEHILVLDAGSGDLRMAMPFSAVSTAYTVTIGNKWWWAN